MPEMYSPEGGVPDPNAYVDPMLPLLTELSSTLDAPAAEPVVPPLDPEGATVQRERITAAAVSLRVSGVRVPGFEDDIVPVHVQFDLLDNGASAIEPLAIRLVHDQYREELDELEARLRGAHHTLAEYPDMFAYEAAVTEMREEAIRLREYLAGYRDLLTRIEAAKEAGDTTVSFAMPRAATAYQAIVEGIGILAYEKHSGTETYRSLMNAVRYQHEDV
jgi:hypothetical protein